MNDLKGQRRGREYAEYFGVVAVVEFLVKTTAAHTAAQALRFEDAPETRWIFRNDWGKYLHYEKLERRESDWIQNYFSLKFPESFETHTKIFPFQSGQNVAQGVEAAYQIPNHPPTSFCTTGNTLLLSSDAGRVWQRLAFFSETPVDFLGTKTGRA